MNVAPTTEATWMAARTARGPNGRVVLRSPVATSEAERRALDLGADRRNFVDVYVLDPLPPVLAPPPTRPATPLVVPRDTDPRRDRQPRPIAAP